MISRKVFSTLLRPGALSLLLGFAAIAVYGNSLANPFVFDDHTSIIDNRDIYSWWPLWRSAEEVHRAPINGRPVVRLSLALNYAIGGIEPTGYRIFNIVVHWAVAVVLLFFLRDTFRSMYANAAMGLAFVVALWWMLHPLNAECINYISLRSTILMSLFYMLTLYCARRVMDGANDVWGWCAVCSCALGMCSKEAMVTAPVVVLLYDRLLIANSFAMAFRMRHRLYVGLAACWLVLAFLLSQAPHGNTIGFSGSVGAWGYLLNQCIVLWTYIAKVFWPHPLTLDYGFARDLVLIDVWWQAASLLSLFVVSAYGGVRKRPWACASLACFIVLAPTSSVVPLLTEVGAERRMYLPLMAFIVLVVVGGWHLFKDRARWRDLWLKWVVVALIALALGSATHARNTDFATPVSIWKSAVAATPNNARAHSNLALAYRGAGQADMAERHFCRALQCDPTFADAHANLGIVLVERGEVAAAEIHYRRALHRKADHVGALNSLAIGLEGRGQVDSALACYRAALRLDPYLAEAHVNLGALLIGRGSAAEGEIHLRNALALDVNLLQAHYYLGELHESAGDDSAAVHSYRRAIKVRPGYAPAHYKLGNLARTSGEVEEAIAHYSEAVLGHPEWVEARYNLATMLAKNGNWQAAIGHFSKVLEMRPKMVQAHNNMGIVLQFAGRASEAITHFRAALSEAPDYEDAQRNLEAALRTRP